MLKNVKSSYFLRISFSFLNEKLKLELIKYNKILQKIINVTLINYKYFSGKYIEYELNRKGKEYKNDKLLFEGEYLNGKKNGKYKEYYHDGKLEFEGEYLNGKKWNGKCKVYDYNGKLYFEGEYLNGKKNGKCKEYDYNGKLRFEGEYLNGKKWNGKCK